MVAIWTACYEWTSLTTASVRPEWLSVEKVGKIVVSYIHITCPLWTFKLNRVCINIACCLQKKSADEWNKNLILLMEWDIQNKLPKW